MLRPSIKLKSGWTYGHGVRPANVITTVQYCSCVHLMPNGFYWASTALGKLFYCRFLCDGGPLIKRAIAPNRFLLGDIVSNSLSQAYLLSRSDSIFNRFIDSGIVVIRTTVERRMDVE